MKFIEYLHSNKYFTRIFIWVTCIIILIVSVFSTLIYINVKDKVLNREYENSQKVLLQMKYNIEYLDMMIRNLTLSTYNNNDVKALMYLTDEDTYENIKIINNIATSIISVNPYVHSVYIYNYHKKKYYSTSNGMFTKEPQLEKALSAYTDTPIPALSPILREIEAKDPTNNQKYMKVMSYIMYEDTDQNNDMMSAVILNIKLDWLLNNLKLMNQMKDAADSHLYILDTNNQLIDNGLDHTGGDNSMSSSIKSAYGEVVARQEIDAPQSAGYFSTIINNENYLVSYAHLDKTGWTLLEAKPYNSIYANLKQLFDRILFITVIILAIALLLSILVSRGIYKPVRKLVDDVDESVTLATRSRDEFSYLTEVYQRSKELIQQYHTEKQSNTQIMMLYFLKKLLSNSSGLKMQEMEEVLKEINPSLTLDRPIVICIVRIDRYKQFLFNSSMAHRELIRFALINIVTECITKSFVAQMVDMKDDTFTILLNVDEQPAYEQKLEEHLKDALNNMLKYYNLTFSSAISRLITDYAQLTYEYNNTIDSSNYKYVYGRGAIISQALLTKHANERTELDDVLKMENKFIDTLKRAQIEKAKIRLNDLFEQIKYLAYSDLMYCNAHMLHQFKKVIYELNQGRKEPLNIREMLLYKEYEEIETLEDFKSHMLATLQSIDEGADEAVSMENQVVADTIRDIIESNYTDVSLGAAYIGEMMKLSPYKLGKIARNHFGMTVPEYISQIRLQKAVEWMGNSKLSIQEIMRKVGIENESYFYKLFKAKFGMTPREYMIHEDRK